MGSVELGPEIVGGSEERRWDGESVWEDKSRESRQIWARGFVFEEEGRGEDSGCFWAKGDRAGPAGEAKGKSSKGGRVGLSKGPGSAEETEWEG